MKKGPSLEIPKGYVTLDEVSRRTGISQETLWERCRKGLIPHTHMGGRHTRIIVRESFISSIKPLQK